MSTAKGPLTSKRNKFAALAFLGLQAVASLTEDLSAQQQTYAHIGLAAAQAALQVWAHKRNPDGSDARQPWQPDNPVPKDR